MRRKARRNDGACEEPDFCQIPNSPLYLSHIPIRQRGFRRRLDLAELAYL